MRPEHYDGSDQLTMTASEWRQEHELRCSWEEESRRVAEWRDAQRKKITVVVVCDGDPAAGVYIAAAADAAAIVARAGEQAGCPWLERGGWPLTPGRRMVQVGEDAEQATYVARLLQDEHPALAAAVDASVDRFKAAARARRQAVARAERRTVRQTLSNGAPHALAA